MFHSLALLSSTTLLDSNPVVFSGNFFGNNFAITLSQIIYWSIAAIVGIIAEFVVGWRLPFGIVGAVIASLIGIWIFTNIIILDVGSLSIAGQKIPVIQAFLGAIIVVAVWHALTFPEWRRRHSYYRGYRNEPRRRRRRRDY